jgi:hypothetical protein
MNGLEAQGRLWASGPFVEEGVLVGDGLTILSTGTIDEARKAMEEEPLIRADLRLRGGTIHRRSTVLLSAALRRKRRDTAGRVAG